jgi:glycosyltransferase involved in cell wall biosynthesis
MIANSVSVVLPSIGRASLVNAIDSALNQTHPPEEVIVILNGNFDHKVVMKSLPRDSRLIVRTIDKVGVSAARNKGIELAKSEFIAFLDDDDEWALDKTEVQLKMNKPLNADILACRAHYKGRVNSIKPKRILKSEKILERIYSSPSPLARRYAIPTPTVLVRTVLAKEFLFDESLSEREDLWFFHVLQKNGAKINQIPEVLVTVNSRKLAGDRVIELDEDLEWFSRLELIKKNLGWNFLFGVGLRNRIASGKPFSAIKLFFLALKQ